MNISSLLVLSVAFYLPAQMPCSRGGGSIYSMLFSSGRVGNSCAACGGFVRGARRDYRLLDRDRVWAEATEGRLMGRERRLRPDKRLM